MSLVFNIHVQVFPLRENFCAFVNSIFASKTKQSAGVRLSEETLTCNMERCVSIAQTKKRAEIETFLLLQSRCKSEHFCEKSEFNLNFDISKFPKCKLSSKWAKSKLIRKSNLRHFQEENQFSWKCFNSHWFPILIGNWAYLCFEQSMRGAFSILKSFEFNFGAARYLSLTFT